MARKKRDGFYKRGRFWWTRCPVEGKPVSTKCTSIDAARAWRNARELEKNDPAFAASKKAELGDWSKRYLKSKANRAEATRKACDSKVRALLKVLTPERKLATIGPGAIDEYIDARRADTEHPGDYTIRREVVHLLAILKLAKRSGCYSGDIDALMPPGFEGRYKPRQRALTEVELGAFLAALPSARWRTLAAVCVAVGCRLSEAYKLTRNDIDLDAAIVHVAGTKTEDAERELPILSPYRTLLEATMPNLPVGPISNVDRTFKIACRKAGIDRCSPNDLRRTHSTLLGERGVQDDSIARLLGHTTTALAKRTYNRAQAKRLAPVIEAQLAQAEPIVISAESLQVSDTTSGKPGKIDDSEDYHRPPEPKVADSNSAWRAANPSKDLAETDTETREESRPRPDVITNKRQSGPGRLASGLYDYGDGTFGWARPGVAS